MKDFSLLVWITQLGLSVAVPLAGFVLLALWLQARFQLGDWVLWVGIVLGLISAVDGFIHVLLTLSRSTREKKETAQPPACFNDHD